MIKAIFIAKQSLGPQQQVNSIELVQNKGIIGDRAFDRTDKLGLNITFIEAEEIEQYNNTYKQNLDLSASRRNIVTEGIRLNELVDKEFSIGEVKFKGVELCEPCATLGGLLENQSIQKKDIVRAFTHKAGLRADVLTTGCIKVGMSID